MSTINFQSNHWGHALHGWTLAPKVAEHRRDRILDKRKRRRRYTVLVHSRQYPKPGDRISYPTERGTVTPLVVDATCIGPSDMFRLEILFAEGE